jgi:heterodisulfide reductase subunit C
MTSPPPTATPGRFLEEVIHATPGNSRLDMCIQCGTCGGSCPSGQAMDHTPRQIFAMIRADMREAVFKSNTAWFCVSCYYCTVRCPQEVHITDVMYTIKGMALQAKIHPDTVASNFPQTFIGIVESFGRSYELGLAALHNLRRRPRMLPSMIPMGVGMLTRGRMDITPQRIEKLDQLQAILARAKALEEASQ